MNVERRCRFLLIRLTEDGSCACKVTSQRTAGISGMNKPTKRQGSTVPIAHLICNNVTERGVEQTGPHEDQEGEQDHKRVVRQLGAACHLHSSSSVWLKHGHCAARHRSTSCEGRQRADRERCEQISRRERTRRRQQRRGRSAEEEHKARRQRRHSPHDGHPTRSQDPQPQRSKFGSRGVAGMQSLPISPRCPPKSIWAGAECRQRLKSTSESTVPALQIIRPTQPDGRDAVTHRVTHTSTLSTLAPHALDPTRCVRS